MKDIQGKQLIEEIKASQKAKKAAGRKAFYSSLAKYWTTTKLILVVMLGLAVIGTGIAGIYAGFTLLHGIWTTVVVTCGAVTTATGLVEMFNSVEKVSK